MTSTKKEQKCNVWLQRLPSLHRFSIWLWCIFMIRLRTSSRFCRTCCLGNQLSKHTGSSKCTTGFCRDKQTSQFKKIMQPFTLISVFWRTFFVWLWDGFRSLEWKTNVIMGSGACVYLKEALGILQQIQTAVAAVVLLRNSTVGAPHGVLCKETRGPPADLPLYLQVAEQRTSTNRQIMIKHPSNSTAEGDSCQKRWVKS